MFSFSSPDFDGIQWCDVCEIDVSIWGFCLVSLSLWVLLFLSLICFIYRFVFL